MGGQEVNRRTTKGRANGRRQLQRAPVRRSWGTSDGRASQSERSHCFGNAHPCARVASVSGYAVAEPCGLRSRPHPMPPSPLPIVTFCDYTFPAPIASSVLAHRVALSPAIAVLLPLGSQRVTAVPNARGSLPDLNPPSPPNSNSTLYTPFRWSTRPPLPSCLSRLASCPTLQR